MATIKYDEYDRKRVIRDIEETLGVRLSRVGTRRKYLRDEVGVSYWVFGGYENWHGIPPDMMQAEAESDSDGVLVIAKRKKNEISIFSGPLRPLVNNQDGLAHTKRGDFQFNVRILGRHMFIAEVPDLVLTELGEASYTDHDKVGDKRVAEIKALMEKMSPEARRKVLDDLKSRKT